ncbi:acid protease [Fomitiporia mediterranea MF3/22]|uniref:acid protease n=1 Tax=Fomitiporia mediterranea (strain MF3/22) TaxID=694068 RepID=UPI00044086DB|nr:acid protease [Fomitiporia mediterranea MF3/22]EJD04408.1 acid protease [Fomitiporia mediterranea MF3/22]
MNFARRGSARLRGRERVREWEWERRVSTVSTVSTWDGEAQEARAKVKRDEGNGGTDGVVLDLTLVGDATELEEEEVYTVPVTVGSSGQTFKLQVDTGSSDLWIASKSCSTTACSAGKPKLYDPSSSTATNRDFTIQYLSGSVEGPIVWDRFTLGPYTIDNQALCEFLFPFALALSAGVRVIYAFPYTYTDCQHLIYHALAATAAVTVFLLPRRFRCPAATNVVNESLTGDYSGILGLALPLDSVISQEVPPVTDNVPDGATFISNLFGVTPTDQAPAQFFYSVLLARPNIDRIPSVLAVGRHPSNDLLSDGLTIDSSKIAYSSVLSERDGVHFWKAELRAITVYVNGTAKSVDIGTSVTGGPYPEAVLDTGVPYIISTPTIANAVWGALGISPANDGNYYVPCTTPLNMTITLDNREEIPIHPLDLSAVPASGGSSCIGLFQQSSALSNPSGFGDIILGVPFLRNVYTVMAYEPISVGGIVGNGAAATKTKRAPISPMLGLLNMTNPTTAMDEFNTVRVLNEPLQGSKKALNTSHGLSIGLKVLFALIGFVVLIGALFGARWLYARRRDRRAAAALRRRGNGNENEGAGDYALNDKDAFALAAYNLQPFRSHSFVPSEDTQRTLADPTARLDKKYDSINAKGRNSNSDEEFGFKRSKKSDDSDRGEERAVPKIGDEGWDGHTSWIDSYSEYQPPLLGEWRPPAHERSYSTSSVQSVHAPSSPLLSTSHARNSTLTPVPLEMDVDEFGGLDVSSMVGIGTAARRGSGVDMDATLTNDNNIRYPHSHSYSHSNHLRMSTGSVGNGDGNGNSISGTGVALGDVTASPNPAVARPRPGRPRPGRMPSGPRRTSSTMSRVINAEDVNLS